PYVAFADDDSWWDAGALAAAVDLLQADASLALVTGEVRVMPDDDLDPVSAAQAAGRFDVRWQETPVGRRAVAGFLACAAVVDRARFLAAGGFPVELGIGGEEEPLALALATTGWGLAYAPEAVVRHAPSASRDPRARAGRLARNDVLTAVVHHRPRTVAGRGARLVERIARRELAPSVLAATTVGAPWALAARRVASPATLDRFARI
ncbi:MAG TPA: glycosyltransferase, partial [Acidimicrobiales bacterium]|nr:glycosyltransferase [Acidimicrobiales bacterium]